MWGGDQCVIIYLLSAAGAIRLDPGRYLIFFPDCVGRLGEAAVVHFLGTYRFTATSTRTSAPGDRRALAGGMPGRVMMCHAPGTATVTVCQVLHGLGVGGAEVLAARLARRLGGRFRFVFACLDEQGTLGEQLAGEGFPVHVLGAGPGWTGAAPGGWPACSAASGSTWSTPTSTRRSSTAPRPGWAAGRRPLLFTEHGRPFPDYRRPKRIVANRLLLCRRDRVVGVGQAVRRALIDNEGLPGRPGRGRLQRHRPAAIRRRRGPDARLRRAGRWASTPPTSSSSRSPGWTT